MELKTVLCGLPIWHVEDGAGIHSTRSLSPWVHTGGLGEGGGGGCRIAAGLHGGTVLELKIMYNTAAFPNSMDIELPSSSLIMSFV